MTSPRPVQISESDLFTTRPWSIQEDRLSVSGEGMCAVLVSHNLTEIKIIKYISTINYTSSQLHVYIYSS